MVYLLATIANDADLTPALLHTLSSTVGVATPPAEDETWGLGYYADRRALIIRKPVELLTSRVVYELGPTVQSRIVVASVTRGAALDQTPPYRFRSWLFGFVGDFTPLEALRERIVERLPGFILPTVDEQTGSLVFGMYLSEMHRSQLLDDALATPEAFAKALARTSKAVDGLTKEAGAEVKGAMVATQGSSVLMSSLGLPLYYRMQAGLESLPDGPPDPAMTDFKRVAEALKRFRAVVVAANVPNGAKDWTVVGPRASAYVDSSLEVHVLPAAG